MPRFLWTLVILFASSLASANGLSVPAEEHLPEWAPCLADREAFLRNPARPIFENYRLLLEDARNEALLETYRPLIVHARAAGVATDETLGVLLRRNFADAAELACLTTGRVPWADKSGYSIEHYRRAMLLVSFDLNELKAALHFLAPPNQEELK